MSPDSFAEAEQFFRELYEWLLDGLLPIPPELNAAERFKVLWWDHLEFRESVDEFVRACLNPQDDANVTLRTKAQRQLFVRLGGAISLLHDHKSSRSTLIRLALSGDNQPQAVIDLLLLRLWETDAWPRVCFAKHAQHGLETPIDWKVAQPPTENFLLPRLTLSAFRPARVSGGEGPGR